VLLFKESQFKIQLKLFIIYQLSKEKSQILILESKIFSENIILTVSTFQFKFKSKTSTELF
jgi:hypothetical protein